MQSAFHLNIRLVLILAVIDRGLVKLGGGEELISWCGVGWLISSSLAVYSICSVLKIVP